MNRFLKTQLPDGRRDGAEMLISGEASAELRQGLQAFADGFCAMVGETVKDEERREQRVRKRARIRRDLDKRGLGINDAINLISFEEGRGLLDREGLGAEWRSEFRKLFPKTIKKYSRGRKG